MNGHSVLLDLKELLPARAAAFVLIGFGRGDIEEGLLPGSCSSPGGTAVASARTRANVRESGSWEAAGPGIGLSGLYFAWTAFGILYGAMLRTSHARRVGGGGTRSSTSGRGGQSPALSGSSQNP